MSVAVACTSDQKVPITVSAVTGSQKSVPITGAVRVSVASGDGTVEQDPATPLVFFAVAGTAAGVTRYVVQADVTQGEAQKTLDDSVLLAVGVPVPTPQEGERHDTPETKPGGKDRGLRLVLDAGPPAPA